MVNSFNLFNLLNMIVNISLKDVININDYIENIIIIYKEIVIIYIYY